MHVCKACVESTYHAEHHIPFYLSLLLKSFMCLFPIFCLQSWSWFWCQKLFSHPSRIQCRIYNYHQDIITFYYYPIFHIWIMLCRVRTIIYVKIFQLLLSSKQNIIGFLRYVSIFISFFFYYI